MTNDAGKQDADRDDGKADGGDFAALDALLADAAAHESYIDDAGFTALALGRLPVAANFALRRWILLGFGAAAAALGLLLFGGGEFIWNAALDLVVARRFGTAQFTVLVFALVFYWSLYTGLRAPRE